MACIIAYACHIDALVVLGVVLNWNVGVPLPQCTHAPVLECTHAWSGRGLGRVGGAKRLRVVLPPVTADLAGKSSSVHWIYVWNYTTPASNRIFYSNLLISQTNFKFQ